MDMSFPHPNDEVDMLHYLQLWIDFVMKDFPSVDFFAWLKSSLAVFVFLPAMISPCVIMQHSLSDIADWIPPILASEFASCVFSS